VHEDERRPLAGALERDVETVRVDEAHGVQRSRLHDRD
jgi:hypothetical protein